MERTTMRGRICGTGSYIPEHYYDNNDLAKFVETNDEWIRERTGIVRRHIAEEDTTVSMAIKAAKNALTDAKLNADDLDLILVSTITPNVDKLVFSFSSLANSASIFALSSLKSVRSTASVASH